MGMTYEILSVRMNTASPAERVRLRLQQWMDTTKIGQRQLADDLQKTQVWLQKVLAGENHIRLRDLDDVARALHTTASELVRDEQDRYQFELTPTEVRVIEHMRHRPETLYAIATLLRIEMPNNTKTNSTKGTNGPAKGTRTRTTK